MITYATIGTNDFARARTFYDPFIAALGGAVIEQYTDDTQLCYGRDGAGLLVLIKPFNNEPATVGNGSMLALQAKSHAQVKELHALALSLGAQNEGDPGYRSAPFYGAYFRDTDGHKLCVFAMTEG